MAIEEQLEFDFMEEPKVRIYSSGDGRERTTEEKNELAKDVSYILRAKLQIKGMDRINYSYRGGWRRRRIPRRDRRYRRGSA